MVNQFLASLFEIIRRAFIDGERFLTPIGEVIRRIFRAFQQVKPQVDEHFLIELPVEMDENTPSDIVIEKAASYCSSGNISGLSELLIRKYKIIIKDKILDTDINLLKIAMDNKHYEIVYHLLLAGITINNETFDIIKTDTPSDKLNRLLALMLYLNASDEVNFNTMILQERDNLILRHKDFKKPIESFISDNIDPHTYGVIFDKKFHKAAFKEWLNIQETKPLLEIVRFAILGLHDMGKKPNSLKRFPLKIIVDDNECTTEAVTLGDTKEAYGVYYNRKNTLYIAGKRDMDLAKSKFLARGTLIHEITHFVANEVFNNGCKPYQRGDSVNKKVFEDICNDIKNREDLLDAKLERVKAVFAKNNEGKYSYPTSEWHCELIVRVPQIIAMYDGTEGYDILKKECSALLEYYQNVFLPACQKHVLKLHLDNKIIWPAVKNKFDKKQVFECVNNESPVSLAKMEILPKSQPLKKDKYIIDDRILDDREDTEGTLEFEDILGGNTLEEDPMLLETKPGEASFNQRLKLYKDNRFEEAIPFLEEKLNQKFEISNEKILKEVIEYLLLASDEGDEVASYILGMCYEAGRGVTQDYDLAEKYYFYAATYGNHGNTEAQHLLGCFYLSDIPNHQDYKKAVTFFKYAAEAGHPDAQYYLGYCYENGLGVKKDIYNATLSYGQAKRQGHAEAITSLKNIKDKIRTPAQNPQTLFAKKCNMTNLPTHNEPRRTSITSLSF